MFNPFAYQNVVNCRAKLQLPESLLPKSLVVKHVVQVSVDGIISDFLCH